MASQDQGEEYPLLQKEGYYGLFDEHPSLYDEHQGMVHVSDLKNIAYRDKMCITYRSGSSVLSTNHSLLYLTTLQPCAPTTLL